MTSDLDFWTPIVAALDPTAPIGRRAPRRYYVERPDSPLSLLRNRLLRSLDNPRKIILAGHRGSGKSSELGMLAGEVGDQLAVVWLDAESTFNLFDVGHTELLVRIAERIHEEIPVPKAIKQLSESLATIIEERKDRVGGDLTTEPIKKITGIDLDWTFYDRETRKRLEVRPVLNRILDAVNACVAAAEKKAKRPLLVIVDGLDKLDLDLARQIFVDNPLPVRLNCHLVLTVPLPLYLTIYRQVAREQGFMPYYLPNVKLHERGQAEPHKVGFDFMRSVVARRLDELAPDLIAPTLLDRFIEMSGGVVRELLWLMDRACNGAPQDARHLTEEDVQRAIEDYCREKTSSLLFDYFYEEMAHIQEHGRPTDRRAKDAQGREFRVCDALIEGLYVLGYINAEPWYDVHPLIVKGLKDYLERKSNA